MKKALLSVLFLCFTLYVAAQVSVTARVDKTTLTLDDEITLTVEIKGTSGNILMPELPSLPAFNVYSSEVIQNTVNGKRITIFRYLMLPRFVGKATIGSVRFTYNAKTYQTDPITVNIYRSGQGAQRSQPAASNAKAVSNGNYDSAVIKRPVEKADPNLPPLERDLANQAYARGSENYFLIAAVSDSNPYVNQPVTLAVRFYYNSPFYDAPYQKPQVSNIFMEDEGSSQGTQTIGGVLYRYEEQRYQLAAASPGKATIGPASVRYMTGSVPLSALDRLFGGALVSAEETAKSEPITLQVQPLPQTGKPKSFYGAVGTAFSIEAETDHTQVEAGEAVTLSVTVKGTGNVKATSDLELPSMPGFKIYTAQSVSGTAASGNRRQNYKIFKTVLVPTASGIYTIPTIAWSYFDPNTKTYKTLKTEPITLKVVPSSKTNSDVDFGAAVGKIRGVQTLGQDISYLKSIYGPPPSILSKLSTWIALNWVMLGTLVISLLFASIGRKSLAQKRAYTAARSQLKKALSNEAVAAAVSDYLQHKLKISTGSLPLKLILQALHKRGVTPATAESFSLLWQRLDTARFAPGAQDTQNVQATARQALDILKQLEEEAK